MDRGERYDNIPNEPRGHPVRQHGPIQHTRTLCWIIGGGEEICVCTRLEQLASFLVYRRRRFGFLYCAPRPEI